MQSTAGDVEDFLVWPTSSAISSAGPPWFRSVAQMTSSPPSQGRWQEVVSLSGDHVVPLNQRSGHHKPARCCSRTIVTGPY